MRNPVHILNPRKKRGSILPVTLMVCILAAISAVALIGVLVAHQNLNTRRRDMARAYFAAQGGVAQVLDWGNHPDYYDGLSGANCLFYRDRDYAADHPDDIAQFPNLKAAFDALDPGTDEFTLNPAKYGTFDSQHGYTVGDVKSINLVKAAVGDPTACMFKVRSVGETPSGRERTVEAYINPNPVVQVDFKVPAGLVSMAAAAQGGNGRVFWGESWSKSSFAVLAKNSGTPKMGDMLDQTPTTSYDRWAKYRSEAQLVFDTTWTGGSNQNVGIGKDFRSDYLTYRYPGAPPADGKYENAFEQFIPSGVLVWPDFASKYNDFKQMAQQTLRYYTTDAAGNVYKGPVKDAAHLVVFDAEFGEADRVLSPYDFVFIDTFDGNPPAADGSNLANISNSGSSIGMKGIFYVCANYSQIGAGKPTALPNAEAPYLQADGTTGYKVVTLPQNPYLDGLMYVSGTMEFKGNPVIYGSVVSERGYKGTGTADIYYNHKLKDGIPIDPGNVGSVFRLDMQKNY